MRLHPTRERLREIIHYNPMTGEFRWRVRPDARKNWNTRYAGKIAGCRDKDGYVLIGVDGHLFFAHRLAYIYMYGVVPVEVDHQNHVKDDNRLWNLRNGEHADNMRNQSLSLVNTSGVTGVHLHRQTGKWRAKLKMDGKVISLGLFDSIDAAASARRNAQNDYGFHKNHGEAA